uniref:GtrA family protein n=1 Tax=Flavobacterium sp. TaxID=239 RepID=UPI004047271C
MSLFLRLIKNIPQLRNLSLKQLIRRELQVFLVVGILTVLIDLTAYKSLLLYFDFTVNLAKGCGFLIGTLFSYVANRIWTFQNQVFVSGALYRFLPLYFSTLVINIAVNSLILMAFNYISLIDYIAFIVATACSAILNFLGMKFFVFRITNT